jgi:hypothetical protein
MVDILKTLPRTLKALILAKILSSLFNPMNEHTVGCKTGTRFTHLTLIFIKKLVWKIS